MAQLLLAAATSSLSRGSGHRYQFTWDRTDCSSNVEIVDSGRRVRKKSQQNRTDMVRARQGFKTGVHVWKIIWPKHMRGQHAVIGLATSRAPLSCTGYSALLGSNDQSVGWDIVTNKGLYNDCVISDYPDNKPADYQVGETIVVVANMNDGTLSFFDGEEHLGVCLSSLKVFARNNQALFPAVSVTAEGAVVTLLMYDDNSDSNGEAENEFPLLPALDSPVNSAVGDKLRSASSSSSLTSASSASSLSQKGLYFVNNDQSLQLMNDNTTASVMSGRRRGRFLLSSRPLDSDEMFQVRLDQVSTGDVDSTLLHFGLIDFKSKCNEEQMWTIVSSRILFNGEEKYTFPTLNFDTLQQGQRVGFIRRSDGRLDIYIDGKLMEKCRLSIPSSHAYVCLEGRATQVSLVIENSRDKKDAEVGEEEQALQQKDNGARKEMATMIAEIGKGIEHVLALMSNCQPANVGNVTVAFYEHVTLVRQKLPYQHRSIFSDKLAEVGGGIIVTEYLQFLYSLGLANDTVYKCYFDIISQLESFTFYSRLLAVNLAENGLFDLLNLQITFLTNQLTDDRQKLANLFCRCLGIIGNCARHSENRQHIKKARLDETLCLFLFRTKNAENILLYCYLTIVTIIPLETIEKLTTNTAAVSNLVMLLKTSSTAQDYMTTYTFPKLNTSVGIACYECVLAVTALAHNAVARTQMVANNVFVHLTKFATSSSDPYHQELVLIAIHALLTRDTVYHALQCRELSPLVERLEKSRTDGVQQEAKKVSNKIKSLTAPPPLPPRKSMGAQVLPAPRSTKKDCAFAKLCQKFIAWMKLADDFFDKTHDACCCINCFEADSPASRYLRGQPSKQYGPPIGWFRCGLHVPVRAKACKAFDNYHRAYHGTTVDVVEKILLEGYLLLPGDEALGGRRIAEREGHFTDDRKPPGFDTKKIYLSPSIRYSAHYAYAKPKRITIDDQAYTAQVVFQVLVKPNSYDVGKQTVGATSQLDPRFSNEELEWSTKQRGAIILYGLLCRLQQC